MLNKLDRSKIKSKKQKIIIKSCLFRITSGSLEKKKKKAKTWAFVFFKKLQDNSNVHMDFRKVIIGFPIT